MVFWRVARVSRVFGIGARPGTGAFCLLLFAGAAGAWSASAPNLAPQLPRLASADAATSAPAPGGAGAADLLPLSIDESCYKLVEALRLSADSLGAATTASRARADRLLQTVMAYVERIDGANPTLPYYAWQGVTSRKAPKAGWESSTITLKAPLPQVTALSIRSRHGDLEIGRLSAIDANKTRWQFNRPIRVMGDRPSPEICFLPLPTELAEVHLTWRRVDPKAERLPRLTIEAGVSGVRESAKQARYYLQLAREALGRGAAAEARGDIRQAWGLLRDYQKSRRF